MASSCAARGMLSAVTATEEAVEEKTKVVKESIEFEWVIRFEDISCGD